MIVCDQSITALEEWEKDLVLIQLQKLEELVEDVGVAEEVGSVVGTVE
jgi:hypothetical protein